eukprot:679101-Rhodomonas_salina.1
MELPSTYAMCGTEIAYGATRSRQRFHPTRLRLLAYGAITAYAMCGTEIAYGRSSFLRECLQ